MIHFPHTKTVRFRFVTSWRCAKHTCVPRSNSSLWPSTGLANPKTCSTGMAKDFRCCRCLTDPILYSQRVLHKLFTFWKEHDLSCTVNKAKTKVIQKNRAGAYLLMGLSHKEWLPPSQMSKVFFHVITGLAHNSTPSCDSNGCLVTLQTQTRC